jgi:membrane-bound acyltransferase YfiQ involved in biofilm formation
LSGYPDLAWQSVLLAPVRNLYGFSFLLMAFAFAQEYLNRGGRALDYMSRAAFPVYVLHQSVMMVLAYFILRWNVGIAARYAAIMLSALAGSVALYEAFRRVPFLRVVLGIKERPKRKAA